MFRKSFALAVALFGLVAAQAGQQGGQTGGAQGGAQGGQGGLAAQQCPPCQQTSQKDAYNQADLVAVAKINEVQEQGENIQYQAEFSKTFKGQGQGQLVQEANVLCGGPRLVQGMEYLIAGKKEGNQIKIEKCNQIPLVDNGIPTTPPLWNSVQNNQIFMQGLESKFENSQQSGAAGGAGGAGVQSSQSSQGSQGSQGGQESGSQSSSGQSSSGQESQSQQGQEQGQQGEGRQQDQEQQQPSSTTESSQSQGGQESSQGSSSQSSSQQGSQGGSQGGQEQESQQGGQEQQQGRRHRRH